MPGITYPFYHTFQRLMAKKFISGFPFFSENLFFISLHIICRPVSVIMLRYTSITLIYLSFCLFFSRNSSHFQTVWDSERHVACHAVGDTSSHAHAARGSRTRRVGRAWTEVFLLNEFVKFIKLVLMFVLMLLVLLVFLVLFLLLAFVSFTMRVCTSLTKQVWFKTWQQK